MPLFYFTFILLDMMVLTINYFCYNKTMKILFVCRGNVARSQMAEELLNKIASGVFEITSAGTKLSGPEQPIGELGPVLDNVLAVMNEEGIDMSKNIRNQVTPEMADDADKIIMIIDDRDPVPDYLMDNPKVIRWDVLDPKGQSLEFTRDVKNQIKNLVEKFAKEHENNKI